MRGARCGLAFLLLHLAELGCCQELPNFPDYFSGYLQRLWRTSEGTTYAGGINLTKEYFDGTVGLGRVDTKLNKLSSSVLSTISDPGHEVSYSIVRDTGECSISRLEPDEGQGIVRKPDGSLGFASPTQRLYMVNASEYTYVGNHSAFGDIILDEWQYVGVLETLGVSYDNVSVNIDIAREGMSGTSLNSSGPIPWKISVDGRGSINDGAINVTISSLTRFFDLSFEKPRYDIFDVSTCSPPGDHEVVVVSVPKDSADRAVNLDTFTASMRTSIADYTGLAPIQVGNIQVLSDTGTALLATFQISNWTAVASNVDNLVTARTAYDSIFQNTTGGILPFQVDVGSGYMVNPRQVEMKVVYGSSVVPTPSATIKPVTITVTPSSCQSVPPQLPTSSVILCPSPAPSGKGKTYSRSYVAGIAFGMLLLGSAVTLFVIFASYLILSRYKQQFSLRKGYERHVNT